MMSLSVAPVPPVPSPGTSGGPPARSARRDLRLCPVTGRDPAVCIALASQAARLCGVQVAMLAGADGRHLLWYGDEPDVTGAIRLQGRLCDSLERLWRGAAPPRAARYALCLRLCARLGRCCDTRSGPQLRRGLQARRAGLWREFACLLSGRMDRITDRIINRITQTTGARQAERLAPDGLPHAPREARYHGN